MFKICYRRSTKLRPTSDCATVYSIWLKLAVIEPNWNWIFKIGRLLVLSPRSLSDSPILILLGRRVTHLEKTTTTRISLGGDILLSRFWKPVETHFVWSVYTCTAVWWSGTVWSGILTNCPSMVMLRSIRVALRSAGSCLLSGRSGTVWLVCDKGCLSQLFIIIISV